MTTGTTTVGMTMTAAMTTIEADNTQSIVPQIPGLYKPKEKIKNFPEDPGFEQSGS